MPGEVNLYFRKVKSVRVVTAEGHKREFHVGFPIAVFFMATVMMYQKINQVTLSVGHKFPVVLYKKRNFQKLAKFSV